MQVTQWDFQNKGKSGWTGTSFFALEVPLSNLRPSIINSQSVPCDRIVQRASLRLKPFSSRMTLLLGCLRKPSVICQAMAVLLLNNSSSAPTGHLLCREHGTVNALSTQRAFRTLLHMASGRLPLRYAHLLNFFLRMLSNVAGKTR